MNSDYELKEPTTEAVERAGYLNEKLEKSVFLGNEPKKMWNDSIFDIEKYTVCGSQVGTVLRLGSDTIIVYF